MPREPTGYHRFYELWVKWAEESNILTAEPETREEIIQLIADMLKESVKDESVYLPQDMRWMLANELEYLLSGYRQTLLHPRKAKSSHKLGHPFLESIKREGVHWLSRKIWLGAPQPEARRDFEKAFGITKATVSKWNTKFASDIANPEIYPWHNSLGNDEVLQNNDDLAEANRNIKRLGTFYQRVQEELKPGD